MLHYIYQQIRNIQNNNTGPCQRVLTFFISISSYHILLILHSGIVNHFPTIAMHWNKTNTCTFITSTSWNSIRRKSVQAYGCVKIYSQHKKNFWNFLGPDFISFSSQYGILHIGKSGIMNHHQTIALQETKCASL